MRGGRSSRAHGEADEPARVLMEEGAAVYIERYGVASARYQGAAWNGPTLENGGLVVRQSARGGAGGRGLFQGSKAAPKGTTILYSGEWIGKQEAERRKRAGNGGHIIQVHYRDDVGRLDGRRVADMFQLTTTGNCALLDERGARLGLGSLMNTGGPGESTCAKFVWAYLTKEKIGAPWVGISATREIEAGEEWTVPYGSATPMAAEVADGESAEEGEEEGGSEEEEGEGPVGRRVSIQWCGDKGAPWFNGQVVGSGGRRGGCRGWHEVRYDDGDRKEHDLAAEEASGQLRWLEGEEEARAAGGSSEWGGMRASGAAEMGVPESRVKLWWDEGWWAEVGWTPEEVEEERGHVAKVTRIGSVLRQSTMGVWATMVHEDGKWEVHTVVAESAGMRSVGLQGLGLYVADRRRRFGEDFRIGRMEGEELGRARKGSAEATELEGRSQGDYCFWTQEEDSKGRQWKVLRDACGGREGGAKRVNDARGIDGAVNEARLVPDGQVELVKRAKVTSLDGSASTWAELLRSEVFYDYGEAYWAGRGAPAVTGLSKKAGKRRAE